MTNALKPYRLGINAMAPLPPLPPGRRERQLALPRSAAKGKPEDGSGCGQGCVTMTACLGRKPGQFNFLILPLPFLLKGELDAATPPPFADVFRGVRGGGSDGHRLRSRPGR